MDDDSAKQEEIAEILSYLTPRLRLHAQKLFRDRGCADVEAMLPGTGKSASDLVEKAVDIVLENKLWESVSKEELVPYARTIIRRDFYDLVKRGEYKRTVIIDVEDLGHDQEDIHNFYSQHDDFEAADAAYLLNWLKKMLRPDEKMEAYLKVVLVDGLTRRADIAYALGISVQEVSNIREKVKPKMQILRSALSNGKVSKRKKG